MKRAKLILSGLIIVVSIARCSRTSTVSPLTMPDVGVEPASLNTQIHLWAPREMNSFRINDPINLAVEVTGEDGVIFDRDYGNRMFQYGQGIWLQVENVPTDWGAGSFLLTPSRGDPQLWGTLQVYPWFDGDMSSVQMKIFIVGRILRNGTLTDEYVGGFVDVTLNR